jgi:electron transfer flavoprotein alpha subunit
MAHTVLAFIEQRNGEIKKSSWEALGLARRLAGEGGTCAAVIAGDAVGAHAGALAARGADRVFIAEDASLALYNTEVCTAAVARAADACGAAIVVASATAMGKDLAPRVAARREAVFLPDVIAADVDGDRVVVSRPQYAGKAVWTCAAPAGNVVLTARPNAFPAAAGGGNASAPAEAVDVSDVVPRGRVTAFVASEKGTVDVAEADMIVSGGRGLKGPEHFPLVFALAEALGAGVGASRAVVDAGWIDHDHQVGQTGKTVSPNLYVACGISGAIQHLAGMRTSKRIVAINKDPEAPIFKVADYGLVGDVFEILPKLTEAVKKLKGGS